MKMCYFVVLWILTLEMNLLGVEGNDNIYRSVRDNYPKLPTENDPTKNPKVFGSACSVGQYAGDVDDCIYGTLLVKNKKVKDEDWDKILGCDSDSLTCNCLKMFKSGRYVHEPRRQAAIPAPPKIKIYTKQENDPVCPLEGKRYNSPCIDQQECDDTYHCVPYVTPEEEKNGGGLFPYKDPYNTAMICLGDGFVVRPKNAIALLIASTIIYLMY